MDVNVLPSINKGSFLSFISFYIKIGKKISQVTVYLRKKSFCLLTLKIQRRVLSSSSNGVTSYVI